MNPWFRLYNRLIDDPKVLKLPEPLRWYWVAILCVASRHEGYLPPVEDISISLRVSVAKAAEYVTKLHKGDLLDKLPDGRFRPHNWDELQYVSDNSTPRVKKHREKKRNRSGVTEESVTETVSRNVSRNADETDPETPPEQSRTDTESEQSRADTRAPEIDLRENEMRAVISGLFGRIGKAAPDLSRCRTRLADGRDPGIVAMVIGQVLARKPDVASLNYFDAAIRDAHANAAVKPAIQVVSSQEFIVEGTPAWRAWEHHLRQTTGSGSSPVTDERDSNNRITGRRGWWRPTKVPEGYDAETGEPFSNRGAA